MHNWGQNLSQTDRQTDKFFYTIYRVVQIFLSVKFVTSLLASLAGGLSSKLIDLTLTKGLTKYLILQL